MEVKCRRPPIIILGMHRSGTSLVTELLHSLGLYVGHELYPEHESAYFVRLNEILFRRVNAEWDNPLPMRSFLACDEAVRMTTEAMNAELTSRQARQFFGPLGLFRSPPSWADFDQPWGWKDPRNVFGLKVWLKLFPGAKLIYIYRNGVDVAASLVTREKRSLEENSKKFTRRMEKAPPHRRLERAAYMGSARCLFLAGAFELWQEYMVAAEETLVTIANPTYRIRYEDFLANPSHDLTELAKFCALPLATQPAIEQAAAKIDTTRASAYSKNSELSAFYETVRSNPIMAKNGYDSRAG